MTGPQAGHLPPHWISARLQLAGLVLALGAAASIILAEARHVLRPFLGDKKGSPPGLRVCSA